VILRCTANALALLGVRLAALPDLRPSEDDWYLNLLWIERRKCLLLTHAETLFPVLALDVRKADLRPLGPYVVNLIGDQLRTEGLPPDAFGLLAPDDVRLAKTASRSVLGVMNNAAFHARYRIEAMGGIDRADPLCLNQYLRRTLHSRAGSYATPLDLLAARLRSE
jgi:hypothetical protein